MGVCEGWLREGSRAFPNSGGHSEVTLWANSWVVWGEAGGRHCARVHWKTRPNQGVSTDSSHWRKMNQNTAGFSSSLPLPDVVPVRLDLSRRISNTGQTLLIYEDGCNYKMALWSNWDWMHQNAWPDQHTVHWISHPACNSISKCVPWSKLSNFSATNASLYYDQLSSK